MTRPIRRCCPLCARDDHDHTLVIWDTGQVHCHRCGPDAWREIRDALRAAGDLPEFDPHAARDHVGHDHIVEPSGQRWSARADAIWRRAVPLRSGDLVHRYLSARRCLIPDCADLRSLPATDRHPWPCLVARVTCAITGEPLTLHITRLAHDGATKAPIDVPRTYLAGHTRRHGVIRLDADDTVTHGLAIAEGIESALSAAHVFRPVWSCIDASGIASFPVLAGIECLSIFADHDPHDAGLHAAERCAERWHRAGREVVIIEPPIGDLNDVVRGLAA